MRRSSRGAVTPRAERQARRDEVRSLSAKRARMGAPSAAPKNASTPPPAPLPSLHASSAAAAAAGAAAGAAAVGASAELVTLHVTMDAVSGGGGGGGGPPVPVAFFRGASTAALQELMWQALGLDATSTTLDEFRRAGRYYLDAVGAPPALLLLDAARVPSGTRLRVRLIAAPRGSGAAASAACGSGGGASARGSGGGGGGGGFALTGGVGGGHSGAIPGRAPGEAPFVPVGLAWEPNHPYDVSSAGAASIATVSALNREKGYVFSTLPLRRGTHRLQFTVPPIAHEVCGLVSTAEKTKLEHSEHVGDQLGHSCSSLFGDCGGMKRDFVLDVDLDAHIKCLVNGGGAWGKDIPLEGDDFWVAARLLEVGDSIALVELPPLPRPGPARPMRMTSCDSWRARGARAVQQQQLIHTNMQLWVEDITPARARFDTIVRALRRCERELQRHRPCIWGQGCTATEKYTIVEYTTRPRRGRHTLPPRNRHRTPYTQNTLLPQLQY